MERPSPTQEAGNSSVQLLTTQMENVQDLEFLHEIGSRIAALDPLQSVLSTYLGLHLRRGAMRLLFCLHPARGTPGLNFLGL
jgi:hypothetical protein